MSVDGRDNAFIPAQEDVPTYMPPMLNDIDRNVAYETAIAQTLRDFAAEHGRPATVLDVGAGTGMLTVIALKHGAPFGGCQWQWRVFFSLTGRRWSMPWQARRT